MIPFTYERAADAADAVKAAGENENARFIAGGTNLLDLMKLHIEAPTHLIDISRLPLTEIAETADGGLKIGAMATNTHVAGHDQVRSRYPVLTQAIVAGGSAQLRNKASVGGNLMQRTRCPYFYDTTKPCNKRKPGAGCSMLEGLNRNAAIFGASDHCVATNPSDMQVALAALDASVETLSPSGTTRTLRVADLHRLPGRTPHLETNLAAGELITAVVLPPPPKGQQAYRKVRDRASYAGGLASIAVAGGKIALGAVSLIPWRATRAEAALARGASPKAAMESEVARARGYGRNDFKIELVARLGAAMLAGRGS